MDGFTIPVTFDRMTLLAALMALLAIASVVSGVMRLISERRFRLFRFGGGVIFLLLGLAVFALAGWAQTYRSLTSRVLVATVQAVPAADQGQTMLVLYTPVTDGKPGGTRTVTLRGDEWQLGGDIIKWSDWLNVLGVHTGYRITRLMGYYENATDYQTKPVTAFDLANARDSLSLFLRDHANWVPFVQATYGNDVRMRPNPGVTYQVYLSTSGYWAAQN